MQLSKCVEFHKIGFWLLDVHGKQHSTLEQLPSNTNLKTGGRDQESPNSAFVASRLPAKNQPSCWLRSGPLAGDLEPHTSDVGLRAFLQCLYCNGGTVTLCCKDEWKLKIVWKSLVLYPSFPKSFKELSENLGFGKWSQPLYAVCGPSGGVSRSLHFCCWISLRMTWGPLSK